MLFFVPTPIGNLSDISQHSLQILADCEVIFCEDTRVSKSLLNLLKVRYQIDFKPKIFYSFHTHNCDEILQKIDIEIFKKICVFVSDAGMPGISDPGIELVKFAQKNCLEYEVISGSNAILIAVVSSGLVEKEFSFLGFLSNTGKQRAIEIENLLKNPYPCVVYESPKRVLNLIENIVNFDDEREIFAIKEATKKFETKFKDNAKNLLEILKNSDLRGEWCFVISSSKNQNFEKITSNDILNLDIPPKIKAKLLSKITGEDPKSIYKKITK